MYKIAPIVHVLSKLAVLYAVLLLVPTLVSYLYHDSAFNAFAGTALATLAGSTAIWAATRKHDRELRPRDGFTLVFLLWLGFAAISALPFYLYFPNIGYTDAFFEAVSGLTTTGATVISSLDTLAPSLNFWRHMMNWLGGMGIIVLAVAILPMLGVGGTQLFKAEIPGIDKDSKMAPRISQTAKRLWLVYLSFTLLTCMGLKWAGMGWFDAVCHAMSAFSLGGFSTHDASIAFFDSPAIEAVLIAATILGAVNFASHFAMAREKSPKPYWRDEEARAMLTILAASIAAASVYMWQQGYYTPLEALRYVGFNFVSIGLANGFANADFATWPLLVTLWMFFLSNVLANTGSMGGGIKMARALVLAKFSLREVSLLLHPNAVRTVKLNRRSISDRRHLHAGAAGQRHGLHHRPLRHHRLHHQRRPRTGRGRPRRQLRRIKRPAKMDVRRRHAARPAGNLYRLHPLHTRLLEKIIRPSENALPPLQPPQTKGPS